MGDTLVARHRHCWADWHALALTLRAPAAAFPPVTVTMGPQQYTIAVSTIPRQISLLDAIQRDSLPLRIHRTTTVVAGDRRALGVGIGTVSTSRMAMTPLRSAGALLLWLLLISALALWL